MRAGPLSDPKVISLLNAYFVPVYISNEDYDERGSAPKEEKKEHDRIYHQALEAKLSAGTVHVYILTPEGKVLDSRHVAKAAEPGEVARLLESVVGKLKTPPGEPLAQPAPQSAPKGASPGSLVLHLTARGKGCSWEDFPSESWIVLERAQAAKLLPPGEAVPGSSWEIDHGVSESILRHFFPQTENNDASPKRILDQSLKANLISVKDGVAHARLEGKVKLKHNFYPGRDDGRLVEAAVTGYVDFEPAVGGTPGRVRSLRLVTGKATYGPGTISVSVRSM